MAKKRRKLVSYAPACPACGTPMLSVGSRFASGWWCPEERRAVSDPTPLCETRKSSLGYALVIGHWAQVDTDPAVLASALPVFDTAEWDAFPAMPAPERAAFWNRRARAMLAEREDRAADPKRRIDRGTSPATEPAAIGW